MTSHPGDDGPYDPGAEGAHMSFDGRMSYGDYLRLDLILEAQEPRSDADDELLFIIQHQTSELWMKLAVHELRAARSDIVERRLPRAFKRLARVSRIFEQLNSAWEVLRTMTPSDYTTFRDQLGQSSGFQSHQYRMIEFVLGNRNQAMLRPHVHTPDVHIELESMLKQPSLYDAALGLLADEVELDRSVLERDRRVPHVATPELESAWAVVYRDTDTHWDLYQLAEKLMDLEDYFRRWRFNHVTTVERVIGMKRGTGGTGGITYLQRMLDVVLFPDLWNVRTDL